jgi:hypothetical protein
MVNTCPLTCKYIKRFVYRAPSGDEEDLPTDSVIRTIFHPDGGMSDRQRHTAPLIRRRDGGRDVLFVHCYAPLFLQLMVCEANTC